MLRLKGCRRCNGDVYFDWDFYGWFEQCLQCGYMHYLQTGKESERPAKKTKVKEVTQAT